MSSCSSPTSFDSTCMVPGGNMKPFFADKRTSQEALQVFRKNSGALQLQRTYFSAVDTRPVTDLIEKK